MRKQREIVLASSSPYRKSLIARLGLDCTAVAPDIDESELSGETPLQTALRLAEAKARRVSPKHPDAVIIGSDQVAVLDGSAIGKPGTHEAAVSQLQAMSGRTVVFHTALCVLDTQTAGLQSSNVPTSVSFRELSREQIERYLLADQPYDCAGSAKIESLGIALVEKVESDDPSALIGLPLIALVMLLRNAGVEIP